MKPLGQGCVSVQGLVQIESNGLTVLSNRQMPDAQLGWLPKAQREPLQPSPPQSVPTGSPGGGVFEVRCADSRYLTLHVPPKLSVPVMTSVISPVSAAPATDSVSMRCRVLLLNTQLPVWAVSAHVVPSTVAGFQGVPSKSSAQGPSGSCRIDRSPPPAE